jgi:BirA family transcriptional regulator, biotin operon repressor / biotin---[acetyl-CoA-carboxylase] ligase
MIHRFEVLDSTQDRAHEMAAQGAPAGSVVIARDQSTGRGTRGREWSSGIGGLWLSVILRPAAPVAEGLSVRVGLELAEALSTRVAPARIELKWPNDLVARHRKLGGVLVEARWAGLVPAWVVVGVGLNVANRLPESLAATAIRLVDLDATITAEAVESLVIGAIERAAAGAGGPFSPAELDRFERRDWLRGRQIASPIEGTVIGLAADGRLLVAAPDGRTEALTGPVTLVGLAAPADGA